MQKLGDIALETAKRDIASRIRRVCEHYEPDEFLTLVERMARIEVKYRRRDDRAFLFSALRSSPSSH